MEVRYPFLDIELIEFVNMIPLNWLLDGNETKAIFKKSMKGLLDEGYDAVFVGSGAPKGKELKIPGREEGDANIHIGITWLESVAFEHIQSIGKRVLIIGVGNTAMDCCRTSLRLGAEDVKVMARKPREFFKASDWELEDAEEENVEIIVNHSPKEFVIEDGCLVGMIFNQVEYDIEHGRIVNQLTTGEIMVPCDDVILALGQENAFPWIERDLGMEFDQWDVPVVDEATFESTLSMDTRRRFRYTVIARAKTWKSVCRF